MFHANPYLTCDECGQVGCVFERNVSESVLRQQMAHMLGWTHRDGKDYCRQCSAIHKAQTVTKANASPLNVIRGMVNGSVARLFHFKKTEQGNA